MRKANDLREYLTRHNRFLRENPDRLHVFVDQGTIVSTASRNLSHEYRFTLTIVLTDYAGPTDAIMLPLLAWIRVKQPDLLANKERRENAISFEVELLNHDTADVEIKLPLTESVLVQASPNGGGLMVDHLDEPIDPEMPTELHEVDISIPGADPIRVSVPAWPHPYE